MNAGKKLEGRKKGATSRRPAEHYYFRVQNSAPRDFAYRPFYGVPNVTPYIAAVDGDWTRACLVVSKISRSKKSEALTYYDSRRPFLLPLSRRKINLLGLSVVSRRITYLSAPRPSPFSVFISL